MSIYLETLCWKEFLTKFLTCYCQQSCMLMDSTDFNHNMLLFVKPKTKDKDQ